MVSFKSILRVLLTIIVLLGVSFGFNPIQKTQAQTVNHVSACQALSTAGATYYLDIDISGVTNNCFTISGAGITLDGQNHTITSSATSGGSTYATVRMMASNVTVKNLKLNVTGSVDGAFAIFAAESATIDSSSVTITGNSSEAIAFSKVTIVSNNTISHSGGRTWGIVPLNPAVGASLTAFGNNITTRKTAVGHTSSIYTGALNSCQIYNNTVTGYDDNSIEATMGIRMDQTSNCIVHNNNITGQGQNYRAFYLDQSYGGGAGINNNQVYANIVNISGGSNTPGFRIRNQVSSKFYNNTITSPYAGFVIGEDTNNKFDQNEFYGNCINAPQQFSQYPYVPAPSPSAPYGTNNVHDNVCSSNFSLIKSADKTQVKSGDVITYTIQYSATAQANNVVITDSVPANTSNPTAISNGGTYNSITGIITWNLGNLSPPASGSLTFKVTVI